MGETLRASRWTYAGLFLVALTTLFYEVLLTRIFSVVMWYHYGFIAISVAMFGMTVGAVLVYLFPGFFTWEKTKSHLALASTLFGVSVLFSFMMQQSIPFNSDTSTSIISYFSIGLIYAVVSVPFIFSGVAVCLALTRFSRNVSALYAADLVGAALGCFLFVAALEITDGPTAVIGAAAGGVLGGVVFGMDACGKKLFRVSGVLFLVLAALFASHAVLVHMQYPVFRLLWVRGELEERPLYERWNSHSRITVLDVGKEDNWFGPTLGMSPVWKPDKPITQKRIWIDVHAGTPMTEFHGDLEAVDFFKSCMMNTAHYLRPNSDVLVIGVGGGKDVLSALVFDQKSVLGLEVNTVTYDLLENEYANFTGNLGDHPKVTLVNDEARSYITRMSEKVDIITIPFVDSFAATAAGAYVMAENTLYTVEAWDVFLAHLRDNGILTATRFYEPGKPLQVYRLVALAHEALKNMGAEHPRKHIAVLKRAIGVGTILVCRSPFSEADIDTIEQFAEEKGFEVVLSPRSAADASFEATGNGVEPTEITSKHPVNLSPPTDDQPFFFNVLRLRDALGGEPFRQPFFSANLRGVRVLGILLVTVTVLTVLCIIVPIVVGGKERPTFDIVPFLIYFAAIGCAFMLIEISQMQRLVIFLGHPTYALVCVLSVILVASGLGSLSTNKVTQASGGGAAWRRVVLVLAVVAAVGAATPWVLRYCQAWSTPMRLLVAGTIVGPLGFVMGMLFPIGMSRATERLPAHTSWFWGINGATSVLASVVAVAIALEAGISTSYWTGFACYVAAALAFAWQASMRSAKS